jgi:thiaminase/transcriptional activator TenA
MTGVTLVRRTAVLPYSRIAENLKQSCIAEWNLLLNYSSNKFIAEMASETLPIEKFIFYLKQDHAFLKEFCSFLLKLRDAVQNPSFKTWLADLHQSTVNHEMQMQKQLLGSLGLSQEDIEMMVPARATRKYISFLRKLSENTSIEGKVSAMAPCPWSYLQIAQEIRTYRENKITNRLYLRWAEFYASQESQQQVEYLKVVLGQLYLTADRTKKSIMERSFCAACNQEYRFWKMAYDMDT